MLTLVVIPARYESTRFPGKMLARDPRGRILSQYVYDAAARAERVDRVIVATDDERIAEAVEAWGGEARMTSPEHRSGTDRVVEVARDLPEYDVVINLQGDEPQLQPRQVDMLVELLRDHPMSTLVHPIRSEEEFQDPNVVKCVFDAGNRALYFSRAPIPFVRDEPADGGPVRRYRHVGVYGFRRSFLLKYSSLGACPLEAAEKLEQLRVLYYGYRIRVGITDARSIGVDTPEDFERFCEIVRREMAEDA